ncbi:hypothetical protein HA388_28350, partial [Escherichia coli]|nr:hypothetical protein [Escherichia coli]
EYHGSKIILHFGAVDEEAWVYLDGRYVDERTVKSTAKTGTELWNEPFHFDITEQMGDCSGEHQLTVRVHDAKAAGDIWRKVWLEATDQ